MKRTAAALAVMLLALLAYRPAVAQEQQKPTTETLCYLAYMRNACLGYMKMEQSKEGDQTRVKTELLLKIKRSLDEQAFEIRETSSATYGANWKPLSDKQEKFDGQQKTLVDVAFSDKAITITESTGGEARKWELSLEGKNFMDDRQVFEKLKAEDKLKAGERFSFDHLNVEDKTLNTATWIIGGEQTRKVRSGEKLTGIGVTMIQGGSRTETLLDASGIPLWILDSGIITLERAARIPEPFVVDVLPTIKTEMTANVVIPGKMQNIQQVEIHFEFPVDDGDGVPPLLDNNAYHDVVRYDQGNPTGRKQNNQTGYAVRLKHQRLGKEFKGPAFPLAKVDDAVKRYLAATPMCDSEDEVLSKKALEKVKNSKDCRSAAEALCRYVYFYLKKESGTSGTATARQAFDEKKGDCTEHAALFVALARASGLPARCCSGVVYICGRDEGMWGYHAWAEVWLGQWVPVDPTVNEMGTSARYLFFQYDEPGVAEGNGRTARCLANGLEPLIDAYKLAGEDEWRREGAPKYEFTKK